MATSRYYRVAGFDFGVLAPAAPFTFPANYAPFLISEAEAHDLLFLLTLGELPDTADARYLFSNTSEDDMPRIEVYRLPSSGGWLFRLAERKTSDVCASLVTSADFHTATLSCAQPHLMRFALDNAAMMLFAFTTASRKTLTLHASVTVKDNLGYLFIGHSGAGKSTHSRLWHEAFPDAWLLNDDNPVVRFEHNHLMVYGSPWSGKTPCYKALSAQVRGIALIQQAPANAMRRLTMPEAYAHLLSSASGLKTEPEMMDAIYQTLVRVLETIPVYTLECLPDTDAARLCHDTMNQ